MEVRIVRPQAGKLFECFGSHLRRFAGKMLLKLNTDLHSHSDLNTIKCEWNGKKRFWIPCNSSSAELRRSCSFTSQLHHHCDTEFDVESHRDFFMRIVPNLIFGILSHIKTANM